MVNRWPRVWVLHTARGGETADLIAAYDHRPTPATVAETLHTCFGDALEIWIDYAPDLIEGKPVTYCGSTIIYLHEIGLRPEYSPALTIEQAQDIARERWGRLTGFRLGMICGERACVYRNPYSAGSNAAAAFNTGVSRALDQYRQRGRCVGSSV